MQRSEANQKDRYWLLHKRIALGHQLATGLCNPVRRSRTAFNLSSRHLWIELLAKVFSGCNRTGALSAFTVPLLPKPQYLKVSPVKLFSQSCSIQLKL
jgi:hypothetical protein